MGVTIHYRGRLNDIALLGRLCEELADFAKVMGWRPVRLDEDWQQDGDARIKVTERGAEIYGHLGLKGIQITPGPDAESLWLCFDREGNLRSPIDMVMLSGGKVAPEEVWLSVKTQFAPPRVHTWIVGLLKYVKKKYIADLEVSDEGEFWETGDVNILKEKINLINGKMDQITNALSGSFPGEVTGLSLEEIVLHIERMVIGLEGEESYKEKG